MSRKIVYNVIACWMIPEESYLFNAIYIQRLVLNFLLSVDSDIYENFTKNECIFRILIADHGLIWYRYIFVNFLLCQYHQTNPVNGSHRWILPGDELYIVFMGLYKGSNINRVTLDFGHHPPPPRDASVMLSPNKSTPPPLHFDPQILSLDSKFTSIIRKLCTVHSTRLDYIIFVVKLYELLELWNQWARFKGNILRDLLHVWVRFNIWIW